jgi:hypothetical protein
MKSESGNQPMKTEAQPETVMIFPRAVAIAVSQLKERLQHDYEQTYPSLGEIIRIVLDEEEAYAWELSSFPHLLFPDLVQAHLETLGLEPADTRHERILAPPIDLPHPVAAIC